MNIDKLLSNIEVIRAALEESGFKRDVDQYKTSLGQPHIQSNLASLKDIAANLLQALEKLQQANVVEALKITLPNLAISEPEKALSQLTELLNDPNVDTANFHSRLNEIVGRLSKTFDRHLTEISSRESIFKEYSRKFDAGNSENEVGLVLISLHDLDLTKSLKEFAKTLGKWNTVLVMFHRLVSSESPKEIELLDVRTGSIDFTVNVDIQVSIDFLATVAVAYRAFNMYLEYRRRDKTILEQQAPIKEIEEKELEIEDLLLNRMQTAVEERIRALHEERKSNDKSIKSEGIDASIPNISKFLTDQVVRGTEVRLLTDGNRSEDDSEDDSTEGIDTLISKARGLQKTLTVEERQLLEQKFEIDESNLEGD